MEDRETEKRQIVKKEMDLNKLKEFLAKIEQQREGETPTETLARLKKLELEIKKYIKDVKK